MKTYSKANQPHCPGYDSYKQKIPEIEHEYFISRTSIKIEKNGKKYVRSSRHFSCRQIKILNIKLGTAQLFQPFKFNFNFYILYTIIYNIYTV